MLLRRLLEEEGRARLTGRSLWRQIEAERCVPGRTWQSLKQHYLAVMEPRLNEYGSLTELQRSWLRVPAPLLRRGRRRPYEREEDVAILRFFMEVPLRVRGVLGRAIWQEAERALGPGRTWQSLKERFLKSIVPNCRSYTGEDVPQSFCDELQRMLLVGDDPDRS
ncbi:uncharacterized protein LOC119093884 [Pollicipes pollicipes]|uniref:uncharacterized protein LOC119093884 n=1 Tax=Pollicipes pollicipes TaxID=41117 RepID=UPI0018851FA4|nr:uncharacterized protein LOC119093884 [Pollicipes pollicipes]